MLQAVRRTVKTQTGKSDTSGSRYPIPDSLTVPLVSSVTEMLHRKNNCPFHNHSLVIPTFLDLRQLLTRQRGHLKPP